jgi:hypothetical protein
MKRLFLLSCFLLVDTNLFSADTLTLSDGLVSGDISFTHGLNVGHSVMAFGPNARMAFNGPTSIDRTYDFGMLAVESNWLDRDGNLWDEFYFTTKGNRRVLVAGRNVTDGIASLGLYGGVVIDATQTGTRNTANQSTLNIFDNQPNFATLSVTNLNATSKGAQLILGASFSDTTGWSLQHDPAQNGTQAFAIVDRTSNTLPFQIDNAGRISLGFKTMHTATKPLEVADPKGVREGLNIYSKYKTSDLGRTNVSASADSDFTVIMEPGIWKVSADLFFTVGGGTPGFWAYFDTSGGNVTDGWCRWTFPDSTGGSTAKTYTYKLLGNNTGAYQAIGPATGTGGYFVKGESIVTVISTTSLQLVWGQWSPQASTTTLLAPSCLVATKID